MSISNTCVVTSRSDSSLPGAPIKLMPTGQPSLVRIGRVTSGNPARLAMDVTEISLRLNCSNSACGVFLKGAGPGVVGTTSTVPPCNKSVMRSFTLSLLCFASCNSSRVILAAMANLSRMPGPNTGFCSVIHSP